MANYDISNITKVIAGETKNCLKHTELIYNKLLKIFINQKIL